MKGSKRHCWTFPPTLIRGKLTHIIDDTYYKGTGSICNLNNENPVSKSNLPLSTWYIVWKTPLNIYLNRSTEKTMYVCNFLHLIHALLLSIILVIKYIVQTLEGLGHSFSWLFMITFSTRIFLVSLKITEYHINCF